MYHRRERTTEDGTTTEDSHVDFLNLIVDGTAVILLEFNLLLLSGKFRRFLMPGIISTKRRTE